ncbi:MAG: aminodeoxychorismate synthase component I [Methylococcales bacterium]|nr:aminodeoxychorismate synthase component I [Methylococcales bacterium]
MSSNAVLYSYPYTPDSASIFSQLAESEWAVFLDSGHPRSTQGRYDIISGNPICTLVTHGDNTTITTKNDVIVSNENPFDLLKSELTRYGEMFDSNNVAEFDLPFVGGAIGYFSYDLARCLENLPSLAEDAEEIPEMMVGIYDWAIIVDHETEKNYLLTYDETKFDEILHYLSGLQTTNDNMLFSVTSEIKANFSQDGYAQAFQKIKHYLKEGDCYQVNLTQRFAASCEGDTWQAYEALREINAAPFSAYLNFPDVKILSSSPERFLKLTGQIVETKPIKGTRPRKSDVLENDAQILDLKTSPKDRAENVMIVDLLRNDISKVCHKVRVPKLFEIESYSTVHHLVSTVTGELAANHHALDLLQHCFPGGSITGAPKIRAMEIIEELEPNRRGVYCGAIGYISFNGNMDTNIAIRTLVQSHDTIRFWAGGGIVNDSKVEDEYQESFDKAAAMFQVLKRFQK